MVAGILAGNLVVFPRFFTTYSPKVTRLFSNYRSRKSNQPLLGATPTKASQSWGRNPNIKPSASWPGQHSAKTVSSDYVELKDQGYKADILVPYAGCASPLITNSTSQRGNPKPQPHNFMSKGNKAEESNGTWKTMNVSQSACQVE